MASVGNKREESLTVNREIFIEELKILMTRCSELDAVLFFKLVNLAYNKAIHDDKSKNLIFYHIHNPDTHTKLNFFRSALGAKWVIMVREPIQSCESWIKVSFLIKIIQA